MPQKSINLNLMLTADDDDQDDDEDDNEKDDNSCNVNDEDDANKTILTATYSSNSFIYLLVSTNIHTFNIRTWCTYHAAFVAYTYGLM